MKAIDIKGKQYVTVAERIKAFRNTHLGFKIVTTMLSCSKGECIFKAEILNEQNEIMATGHALEKESSSFINKTSYIENCETSAVGRALGIFGIGIDSDIATADEVINAKLNQRKKTTKKEEEKKSDKNQYKIVADAIADGIIKDDELKNLAKKYGKSKFSDLTYAQAEEIIKTLNVRRARLEE